SRWNWMIGTGAAAEIGALHLLIASVQASGEIVLRQAPAQAKVQPSADEADRLRGTKWWHKARFGMFIHQGLYSVHRAPRVGHGERGHPVSDYAAAREAI